MTNLAICFPESKYFYSPVYCSAAQCLIFTVQLSFSQQEFPDEIKENICDQLKEPTPVPKTLLEYTQEEKDAFPELYVQ